jgi:transcriptional regulator with XRE-family HTH domain
MDIDESLVSSRFDLKGVGNRLRLAREQAGLSQQQFADCLGYSRRQIAAWENGANTPPIWVLAGIREHCRVDPDWVLFATDLIPQEHLAPQDWSRYDRLRRDVEKLCFEVGIELSDEQVEQLARLLFDEAPEAESVAKKKMLKMLRTVAWKG